MNSSQLDTVVEAVLYEGYMLYPYRPSSKKNRQRFTFGRVYPESYSLDQKGAEPCVTQTQCLVRQHDTDAAVEVSLRFLHPMMREIVELPAAVSELPANFDPANFPLVPELSVDGKVIQTWQEARERTVLAPPIRLNATATFANSFTFPAVRLLEPIRDETGQIVAVVVRHEEALAGSLEIAIEPVDGQVSKITARALNHTPMSDEDLENQDAVLARTFASAHTILRAKGAEFFSLIDPPADYAAASAACKNIGVWPVLIGDEKKAERDTLLASPIILSDYPKIAPESAGDLFDGTEIDEILTLRILTMTDAEKAEMRNVDDYARRILERTENLPESSLLKMHGTLRDVRGEEDFFNDSSKCLTRAFADGTVFERGDLVRIKPKNRADAMDMLLAGKTAQIEAIEEDFEGKVHLALVLEDDPGKDLGMLRQPGHRFFYSVDEVEPVEPT